MPACRSGCAKAGATSFSHWSDEPGSRILITAVLNPDLKKYEGKTIAEIARAEKKDPLDTLMDLVIADRANVGRVTFSMSEEDVRTALRRTQRYVERQPTRRRILSFKKR